MNERSDIDRVLRQWFDDGPSRMPDRVVDAVADRIGRERQRPAVRLPWRSVTMNSTFKIGAAVASVIAIAVVSWNLLLPRGSTSIGGPDAPPTPEPSATASASATPPWDAPGQCGATGCGGPLRAGTYTSKSLAPAVTYTLTSDWVNVRDWPEFFQLYPDTPANRALAASEKYPPYLLILPGPITVSPSNSCGGEATTDKVEVDAAGLGGHLASREGLSVTEPIALAISGLTGQQIDVGLEPAWTGCLPATLRGEIATQTDRFRFIVLDTPDGSQVMIRLYAPRIDFDAFVAEAMPIVESFEFDFGPGASPSPS